MFKKLIAAATTALLLASTAQAGIVSNLVTNGGFETGTSGWTMFDNTSYVGTSGSGGVAHSGTAGAFFGQGGTTGGLFQTLNTVAGETYSVSFWLKNNANTGPTNSFVFNWGGGAAEMAFVNGSPTDYAQFTFTLVASSPTTDLRFTTRNDQGYFFLDDVSVTLPAAAPVPTDVPEPASLALVGVALAGAVGRHAANAPDAAFSLLPKPPPGCRCSGGGLRWRVMKPPPGVGNIRVVCTVSPPTHGAPGSVPRPCRARFLRDTCRQTALLATAQRRHLHLF